MAVATERAAASGSLVELERMHRRIEELAACSRWDEVDQLIRERNNLLGQFEAQNRVQALESARKSTDRIMALAKRARLELVGQLADLQRGREAVDEYRANR